jgi:hypothetical protein
MFRASRFSNEIALNEVACPRVVTTAFMFLWCLSPNAMAATSPGAIPGQFGVSDDGSATYSIPIVVPAAIGGLKPSLALTYDSSAGDGLAGMRWTLSGIASITRCNATYAQDGAVLAVRYASTDKFCLDGQRLVPTSSTEFRTEIESFQRITQVGVQGSGPQYFVVEHGDGSKSYYGYTTDSRVENTASPTSSVRIWYISYTEDAFGNRINYTYQENPGEAARSRSTGLKISIKGCRRVTRS